MAMSIERAREILIAKMKEEGTYDETVAELNQLIERASENYAEVPGMGRVSAWELAVDMAGEGFSASEITRAMSVTHGVGYSDALVLAANAMGRAQESAG